MNLKKVFNLAVAVGLVSAMTSCAVSYPIAVTNNKSIKEGSVSQSVLVWHSSNEHGPEFEDCCRKRWYQENRKLLTF